MMRKYSIPAFIVAVVILPLTVYAVVKWYENNYMNLPVLGPEGHKIEHFSLVNQYQENVTDYDSKDKIVIANFFFTHCPVVCPKMTKNLKEVERAFAEDNEITITSFSIDPERDSAAKLKAYAKKYDIGTHWNLLTGNKKDIYKLARKSFLVVATDGDGGPTDFIHSEMLVLLDKDKRIRGYYSGTETDGAKQLIKDIKKLKNEN